MMYRFYLGDILLPIAPELLNANEKNQNFSISLLDESEFNVLKKKGLSSYSFKALLPSKNYHFALYQDNYFLEPQYYIGRLEELKDSKAVFEFTVLSPKYSQGLINKKVSLEGFSYSYKAQSNDDVEIEITLREYVHKSTKLITDDSLGDYLGGKRPIENNNSTGNKIDYVIKRGDTLWGLAKRYYGNGALYSRIYNENKALLDDIALKRGFPRGSGYHWIFPGVGIKIPL